MAFLQHFVDADQGLESLNLICQDGLPIHKVPPVSASPVG